MTGLQGHASTLPCIGRAHDPVVDRDGGRGRGEGGRPCCATSGERGKGREEGEATGTREREGER